MDAHEVQTVIAALVVLACIALTAYVVHRAPTQAIRIIVAATSMLTAAAAVIHAIGA